jgi:hypothetical protein
MNVYDKVGKFGWYSLLEGSDRADYGHTWFVDSNGGGANNSNTGNGASWAAPFLTLNYAISRCSNDAGDVIFVAAGHAESFSTLETASGATTTGACVDKSGVTIIGLGTSDRRPTFTMTAAAGSLNVTATECTLYNLLLVSNYVDVAALITLGAGADGAVIEACEFRDSSAITEYVMGVHVTAACNDVAIRGCRFLSTDTASGTNSAVWFAGASYRCIVQDCYFRGDWGGGTSDGVIDGATAAGFDILIDGNIINNMDPTYGSAINLHASTTGAVTNNICYTTNAAVNALTALGCLRANNKVTSLPAADAVQPGYSSAAAGGNHFYVDSGTGVSTASGLSWDDPLATIDSAIAKCTASNGDVIHVAAGHAESITGATVYILDIDVIGLSIIGEGSGDSRPTLTFTTDAANANVDITAADTLIENIIFSCNMASQAYMIYTHTSADDTVIRNCEFREGGQQPLTAITFGAADGDSDYCVVDNCKFYLPTAGPQTSAIIIAKDQAGIKITNNYIMGNFDNAALEIPAAGNASQDLVIKNNVIINEQASIHCIEVDVAALTVTGVCSDNTLVCDVRSAALQGNILSCSGNIWIPLGGNLKPVRIEGEGVLPGNQIYVDSALGVDDTAHGSTWEEPVATLDYAIGLCADNNGDIIHVAPGHAETIATPGGVTADIIGITIKGYGNGSNMPTFHFDTGTDSTFVISAANVTIENCLFDNTQDALVVAFPVTGPYCTFRNCIFRDLTTDNTIDWITVVAAATDFTMDGCRADCTDTAGNTSFISFDTCVRPTVKNTVIHGDFSDGCLTFITAASTDILIDNCRMENANAAIDSCIQGIAALTGWVCNSYFACVGSDTETTWFETPGNTAIFECYGTNNVGEAGILAATPSV